MAEAVTPHLLPSESTTVKHTDERALKPVFVVGGLYSLANGVAWIMRDLAAALGRAGSPVTVCAADCWGRGADSIGHIFEPPSTWVSSRGLWLGGLSWSPLLKSKMRDVIQAADIVHNHSLWMLPNSYGSRIAARQDKPVVITAHGALEPWAAHNSGWKKRVVGRLFQNHDLQRADCIHVNSMAEVEGIRRYGLTGPVAVIPNGVELSSHDEPVSRDLLESQFPELRERRLIVFLARLHAKKGLEHLARGWAQLADAYPEWHLVIGGPDRGYEQQARDIVSEERVEDRVTFTGALLNETARAARQAAEIFVQPSFSEGFSMSILEAMAAKCPVLITPGCNFPEVAAAEAGVIVEPTTEGTMDGLRSLLEMSNDERAEMGENGRRLIERGYTWDRVAAQTLELYRWLTFGESVPEFVVT